MGPYVDALGEHQRVLRAAFEEHDGREVHTEGDAFFVAFARASDAIAAAVAGQRALASKSWPEGVDVRVRIGVHTGEAAIARDDYVGLDVHRAARICAAGHGGQVLISSSMRELVADELPSDVALRDGLNGLVPSTLRASQPPPARNASTSGQTTAPRGARAPAQLRSSGTSQRCGSGPYATQLVRVAPRPHPHDRRRPARTPARASAAPSSRT